MLHLRRITIRVPGDDEPRGFPFGLPALRGVTSIDLEAPMTILVGENGSGKSTLLEAVAIAAEGDHGWQRRRGRRPDPGQRSDLADALRLTWTKRPGRGFFLRAEDFFGYAKRTDELRAGLEAELERIDREYADAEPYAGRWPGRRSSASSRPCGRATAMASTAVRMANRSSHFFAERLVPGGIYFLDEPEAPLSPARQLSLWPCSRRWRRPAPRS